MPDDAAFYVVAAFPLLSVAGFGSVYMLLPVVRRSQASVFGLSTMWIHLLLLTIPLGATWRDGVRRAEHADLGLQFPDFAGLGPVLSSVGALPAAAAAGVILFRGELLVADAAYRRRDANLPTADTSPRNSASSLEIGQPTLPSYMAAAVPVACAEEYIWRGFLTMYFTTTMDFPVTCALVAANAMFGLHHAAFGLRSCLAKAGHGFTWGLMLLATGSLLPSVVSHSAFQLMVWRRARISLWSRLASSEVEAAHARSQRTL